MACPNKYCNVCSKFRKMAVSSWDFEIHKIDTLVITCCRMILSVYAKYRHTGS